MQQLMKLKFQVNNNTFPPRMLEYVPVKTEIMVLHLMYVIARRSFTNVMMKIGIGMVLYVTLMQILTQAHLYCF